MSSINIAGDTSGVITLQAPAVAGTTTLTLPATSGTVALTSQVGKVLQVVNATYSTSASTSTSTYVDTGLSATITPTSATSKILVIVNQLGLSKNTGNTYVGLRLLRGATSILQMDVQTAWTATVTPNNVGGSGCTFLDSPATTSAVTYKTQFNSGGGVTSVIVQESNPNSTITLMEIAA